MTPDVKARYIRTTMHEVSPSTNPEQGEATPDNAIKFIVGAPVPPEFLDQHGASKLTLTVDWIDISDSSETKLARKELADGTIQLLLISKVSENGERTSKKRPLSQSEYDQLLDQSVRRLSKVRYEFSYPQNSLVFDAKYDVYNDSDQILEIDASSSQAREAFDPTVFPCNLTEVEGIDGPAAAEWLDRRQAERKSSQ